MSEPQSRTEREESMKARIIRLRNGIRTINSITGDTEPTYGEYVLATDYDAKERECAAENAALKARLAEIEKALDGIPPQEVTALLAGWKRVVQKIMVRCADLLDEDQFNELINIAIAARAADTSAEGQEDRHGQ